MTYIQQIQANSTCSQVPVVVVTKYLLVGTRYYIEEARKKNSSIVGHRTFVVSLRNIVIQIIILLDNKVQLTVKMGGLC
jgi:hypothetical protein